MIIKGFWKRSYQARKLITLLFLNTYLVLITGCNKQSELTSSSASENNSDRITIGTISQPRTIDPADNYELSGMMIIYNLSDTLYTYEVGTTKLKPQLATKMPTISKNGLVYTIRLRKGVKFHDGTAFNSEAMAFSLERFMANGGKPSFLLTNTIEKIETNGKYELIITLKEPFSAFPALLAFPGICAVSPQAYQIGKGKFVPNNFVGTGPYKLKKFHTGLLQLDTFDNYWGEKPKNQGINLQIYSNNAANLFNAFRTKSIDIAYQSLTPEQVENLIKESRAGKGKVIENISTNITFMALNVNSEFTSQKVIRKAIATLIDRELFNERIFKGQSELSYTMIPKSFNVSRPVFKDIYNNVAEAKQLLIEAGFSRKNPATIEIWYSSDSAEMSQAAAILKSLAKRDFGGLLKFIPNNISSVAFFKNLSLGSYQSILSNWYPDFLDADNYIYPFLNCIKGTATQNCIEGSSQVQGSFYNNEKINQLITQQRKTLNSTKREEIFVKIQKILAEDVPYIPLWQTKEYAFIQNDINGTIFNLNQTFPFWKITRSKIEKVVK